MPTFQLKPFLVPAALLIVGASMTAIAFSAPKPDAPEIVPPKVKKAVVVPLKRKARTIVRIRHVAAKPAAPKGLLAVVIDEPNQTNGTLSVVTSDNEFGTIAVGPGTRIARGYQLAALSNIHPGYTVRCEGAWDRDGFQYQAYRLWLGTTLNDVELTNRVAAACENIGKARKGGGFGKSLVAMVPTTGLPKAIAIGDPAPSPSPAAPAVPAATGTAPATATPAPGAPTQTPTPVDPSLIQIPPGVGPATTAPVTPVPGSPPNTQPILPPAPAIP